MMRSKSAVFCAAMGACATVSAGFVMELVTTEYRDDAPIVGTIQISAQDGVSRMEVTPVSEDESGGMIFREESNEFVVIDHEEKEEPMKVQKTGNSDTTNGFDCDYYEVQQQGAGIRELCVTGRDDIEGGSEASASTLAMAGFFDKMAEQFSADSGRDLMGEQRELFQHMRELDGDPVLTREFDGEGRVESESRLKSAKSANLDAALFAPPQGYARKDLGI